VDGKEPIIIGKADLVEGFAEHYDGQSYNLNICHNLSEDFFRRIGNHLSNTGFDNKKSYEAGFAYFSMQCNSDINGTSFLLRSIYNSLSPLYLALYHYPILHFAAPQSLKTNSIFSSILQMFYGGMDQHVIKSIHMYHQHLFYVPETSNFSKDWDFSEDNDEETQSYILHFAAQIRKTDLYTQRENFIEYGDIHNRGLINASINKGDFYNAVVRTVYEKYGILPADGTPSWNNVGDLMQYFAILFYETCLHAMVLKELKESKS
jgi:hypothetical protein